MSTVNILKERFGILNASSVKLFDKGTGKITLKVQQSNEMSLDIKSSQVTAKEQGADAITWNLAKEGTLTLKTETTTFAQLAEMLGSEEGLVLNTTPENYDKSEQFTVTTDGTIDCTLIGTPLSGTAVSINSLTQDGELLKELTGTNVGQVYTIADASLKIGDVVEINYIEAIQAGKLYTFDVASKSSGTAKRLVANVLCTNRNGLGTQIMQLEVPNVMVEQNLTLTCSATKASEFTISMKVMADGNKKTANGEPIFCSLKALDE